jgi:riboflavin kinase/FMN adenylyltransferase
LEVSFTRGGAKFLNGPASRSIALGNFDGLHLGHKALFKALLDEGSEESIVLTLYPHPRAVLSSDSKNSPFNELITPLRARARILRDYGIDRLHVVRFSKSLSILSPREFLENYIFIPFRPKSIVVGFDWKFGKDRSGDISLLREIASIYDAKVRVIEEVQEEDKKLGASLVRQKLEEAGVGALSGLLGAPFSFYGRVVHGDGRGRGLGFPTANILLHRQLYPKKGVYVSRAQFQGKEYPSITNIGQRPTFDGGTKVKVETHLLDFDQDIYGEELKVSLIDFIRPELKFQGIDELKNQINIDIKKARNILGC